MEKLVKIISHIGEEISVEDIYIDEDFFNFLVDGKSEAFKKEPCFDRKYFNALFETWYELQCKYIFCARAY